MEAQIFALGQRVAEVSRIQPPDQSPSADETTYFHHDRLGSVVALSDSNGVITHELDYDTYGNPEQAMPTPFGYTGHRHEQDLGLVDAGGRFYDPVFGVFLSADPISPLGGSSPRMNRYAYVGCDSVNFVDPTGLFLEEIWSGLASFVEQAWGHGIVAPTNLLLTGRAWNTTWDTDTTEALFTALAATAAGLACGAATANPAAAGLCAGAVAGSLDAVSAGATSFDEIAFATIMGSVTGGFAGGMGHFADVAVFSSTQSRTLAALAASGASSGTSVGMQFLTTGEVNWAQAGANAAVSGLLAWHRGAQQDAARSSSRHCSLQEVGGRFGTCCLGSVSRTMLLVQSCAPPWSYGTRLFQSRQRTSKGCPSPCPMMGTWS